MGERIEHALIEHLFELLDATLQRFGEGGWTDRSANLSTTRKCARACLPQFALRTHDLCRDAIGRCVFLAMTGLFGAACRSAGGRARRLRSLDHFSLTFFSGGLCALGAQLFVELAFDLLGNRIAKCAQEQSESHFQMHLLWRQSQGTARARALEVQRVALPSGLHAVIGLQSRSDGISGSDCLGVRQFVRAAERDLTQVRPQVDVECRRSRPPPCGGGLIARHRTTRLPGQPSRDDETIAAEPALHRLHRTTARRASCGHEPNAWPSQRACALSCAWVLYAHTPSRRVRPPAPTDCAPSLRSATPPSRRS